MKSNGIVTKFIKFQESTPLSSPDDKRGRGKMPLAQEENQAIIDHINSFNPQLSRCNLEHTPNRKYLDPELSISSLWSSFNATPGQTKTSYSKYQKVLSKYQKVFRSLNIGFGRPSQGKCDVRVFYKSSRTRTPRKIHIVNVKSDKLPLEKCTDREKKILK